MNVINHLIVIIIVIVIPAFLGGILIDVIDHYRTELSFKENVKFMYNCGIKGQDYGLHRTEMTFNIFHRWRHLGYATAFCLSFLLAWLVHLLCDMDVII